MNDNNFNSFGQPQNNTNPGFAGMQPQNNMNTGTQDVQPQNNTNPGFTGVQPQNNTNSGFAGMQPQNNTNPGFPGMQPQNNTNPGFPGMQSQNNMNPGFAGVQPQYNMNPGVVPPVSKKTANLPLIIGISAVGVIALVVIILLVTGVIGGKKLTCTMSDSYMGMTMTDTVVISFKDDKATKATQKQKIDYGTNSEYKEYLKESFEDEIEDYKEDGIDAKLTSDDTSYTLTVTYGKDDVGTSTYEETKEEFEDDGYTCK